MMKFDEAIEMKSSDEILLNVQFQGGFSCRKCLVTLTSDEKKVQTLSTCYPKDSNAKQSFNLSFNDVPKDSSFKFSMLKILFTDLTDFFGRMIIYSLDIKKS